MPSPFAALHALPRRRLIAMRALGSAAIIAVATAVAGARSAADPPSPAAALEQLASNQLYHILGRDVRSANGEVIGRMIDMLVDNDGRPRAAIVDFGGFLGVGSRKIAIDWTALHFAPDADGSAITVDLDRDQLKAAPQYEPARQAVAVVGLSQTLEGR